MTVTLVELGEINTISPQANPRQISNICCRLSHLGSLALHQLVPIIRAAYRRLGAQKLLIREHALPCMWGQEVDMATKYSIAALLWAIDTCILTLATQQWCDAAA